MLEKTEKIIKFAFKYPPNYLLMVKTIIRCMMLRSLPMSIATVLMGCACAPLAGNLDPTSAILCLLLAPLAQITANLYHVYRDQKCHYGENIDRGIADMKYGDISLEQLLREAYRAFGILTLTLGLTIILFAPIMGCIFGTLLLLAIYLNSAGPYPLCRSPWNMVITFLFFGPLGVIATSYVQAVHGTGTPPGMIVDLAPALFAGICMGCFAVNSLIFHDYRTYEENVNNDKRTFCVVFGKRNTAFLFFFNSAVIFFVSLYICITYHFHNVYWAMVVPLICTIYNFWLGVHAVKDTGKMNTPWENLINWNMFLYALSGFIEFHFFGLPEDALFRYF